jgi:hypothetical protein
MAYKGPGSWRTSFVALVLMAANGILSASPFQSAQKAPSTEAGAARVTHSAQPNRANPSDLLNPFEAYIAGASGYRVESALEQFAKTCGMHVYRVAPGYAVRTGERWNVVKNLKLLPKAGPEKSYETLELWHAGPNVVTEQWSIDGGDYYRVFVCLHRNRVVSAESVNWNVPAEEDAAVDPGWGYQVRWELGAGGKFVRTSATFLDLHERPIAAPKLDEDRKKDLDEQEFDMHSWKDLEYPGALLVGED